MRLAYALLMQLLIIASSYVIYFRTTIITGLQPQKPLTANGLSPPAKRLVIFITDGLRAKSFFEAHCNYVPHLRQIFMNQGIVGISRTQAPTESRPGHVALFGGFFEDPASLTTGWDHNAVEFDTVFNQTHTNYAWGAADLMKHFPHLRHVKGFKVHDFDEATKKAGTLYLDAIVLDQVSALLEKLQLPQLQMQGVIFFIHLLGLDEAFHRSNGAEMFRKNLNYTEHRIWQLYERFERIFPDKRTAYLLTSDHGMTDAGAHGGSSKEELETPLMLWGAGIANISAIEARSFVANDSGNRLPLQVVNQIQLTPLMSTLLGHAPPVNNRGILPFNFLNASNQYIAYALYTNALQLLEQARLLLRRHRSGLLAGLLPEFQLDEKAMSHFVEKSNELLTQAAYGKLQAHSEALMPLALECIDYYQNYYRLPMLLALIYTFVGWLYYLRSHLSSLANGEPSPLLLLATVKIRAMAFLLLIFILMQRVPWMIASCLFLPVMVWSITLEKRIKHNTVSIISFKWPIICAGLFTATFYYRAVISFCYFCFACCNNRRAFTLSQPKFYVWLSMVLGLSILPWLPPSMGYWQRTALAVSFVLTYFRPLALGFVHRPRVWICNGSVLAAAIIYIYLRPFPQFMHWTAWAYFFYIIYYLLTQRVLKKLRIELIFFHLSTLYTLLCTSYEALVMQLLAIELQMVFRFERSEPINKQRTIAMYILLYSLYSFFAMGNIEDIDTYRIYLDFCAFGYHSVVMNIIIIAMKLMLPILLILCIIYESCEVHPDQIFCWLLYMCNIMALYFLLHIQNHGSWRTIGTSIVNFVAAIVMPFILLLLGKFTELFLGTKKAHSLELPQ